MTVWHITLERISTGERAQSLVTRQASEEAARAYAQDAIRQSPNADDLWVVDVEAREPELPGSPAMKREASAPEPEAMQQRVTMQLRQDAWKQVKIAAVERGTTAHAVMIEALNDWFTKHGKPPIA